eukprot:scaffold4678_cov242-Pinguiococcus_pyrenoidosus.AAC.1
MVHHHVGRAEAAIRVGAGAAEGGGVRGQVLGDAVEHGQLLGSALRGDLRSGGRALGLHLAQPLLRHSVVASVRQARRFLDGHDGLLAHDLRRDVLVNVVHLLGAQLDGARELDGRGQLLHPRCLRADVDEVDADRRERLAVVGLQRRWAAQLHEDVQVLARVQVAHLEGDAAGDLRVALDVLAPAEHAGHGVGPERLDPQADVLGHHREQAAEAVGEGVADVVGGLHVVVAATAALGQRAKQVRVVPGAVAEGEETDRRAAEQVGGHLREPLRVAHAVVRLAVGQEEHRAHATGLGLVGLRPRERSGGRRHHGDRVPRSRGLPHACLARCLGPQAFRFGHVRPPLLLLRGHDHGDALEEPAGQVGAARGGEPADGRLGRPLEGVVRVAQLGHGPHRRVELHHGEAVVRLELRQEELAGLLAHLQLLAGHGAAGVQHDHEIQGLARLV